MIQPLVDAYMERKDELRAQFAVKHPDSYEDIVRMIVGIWPGGEYRKPDPERIHKIDDGDYQGTLLFVVAAGGYQPSDYWAVAISYGSCSGCDTLEGIREYDDGPPSEQAISDYMTLALHVAQRFVKIGDGEVV